MTHGLLLMTVLLGAAADDVRITMIAGPGDPGPYRHPAAIEELANGDLYLAYYGGAGEYEGDTAVYGKRLKKSSDTWSEAKVIADSPWTSEGNPVVFQAPDGLVWLFYVNRYGETWSDSIIKAKVSKDNAETWSDSFLLTWERGTMVRGKPIVLNDGNYLLPVYHETGYDREDVGDDTTSLFIRIDPKAHTWTETNRIASPNGNLQPAVVQIDDNYLFSFSRRGGGYGPGTSGYIIRSESRDGGKTWSPGQDTEFPNPNAAVDLVKLKNGHIVLVYNDSMTERTPLTVAVSTDNGETWPHRRNLLEGDRDYAYPYIIQGKDERLYLIFTSNGRRTIHLAVFGEDAILGHKQGDVPGATIPEIPEEGAQPQARAEQAASQIAIRLARRAHADAIFVDNRPVEGADELARILGERCRRNPELSMLIKAEPGVTSDTVADILDLARRHRIADVAVAARPPHHASWLQPASAR